MNKTLLEQYVTGQFKLEFAVNGDLFNKEEMDSKIYSLMETVTIPVFNMFKSDLDELGVNINKEEMTASLYLKGYEIVNNMDIVEDPFDAVDRIERHLRLELKSLLEAEELLDVKF